jgi:hypothetical protein
MVLFCSVVQDSGRWSEDCRLPVELTPVCRRHLFLVCILLSRAPEGVS